jgi:PAS domain S-box-containing protein
MSEFGPIDEYRDLFESAPCGYLTIGSDGRITKVNATLTAWTGFEADKFIGRRLHQAFEAKPGSHPSMVSSFKRSNDTPTHVGSRQIT